MNSFLSSSGARVRGDEYQHLIGWIQVIRAVLPNSNVNEVGIEDPDAGNADDITIYKSSGSNEFFQIKSAVDGREIANIDWLMRSSKTGGLSIIKGLFDIWNQHNVSGSRLKITFFTNRPASADDNFISLRDGKDGTVAKRIKEAGPNSKVGRLRQHLITHLNTTDEKCLSFLNDLSFRVGRLYDELREDARTLMYSAGLRYDEEAITLGESIVRGWVTDGKRRLAITDIKQEIKDLLRMGELPSASLLVQAIDQDPMPETATIALNWVDSFDGDEPRTRRIPRDSTLWNTKFRKEIQEAAKLMRSRRETRVLVRGHMRLPTWFTIGVELGRTVGFEEVASFQGNVPWSSKGVVDEYPVEVTCNNEFSNKNEMAIGIALSVDPSKDVINHLQKTSNDIGRYICIAPTVGVGNTILKNDKQVRQWAYNVRDTVRDIAREYQPSKIHLFLSTPHGAALLLGHLWDRIPPTQLYEDLGALGDYLPSFFIHG